MSTQQQLTVIELTQIVRDKLECQKLSLHELLDIMTRMDEELIELSTTEQDLVGVLTVEKVDNIKNFKDFVEARSKVLAAQAKELSTAKKQLENLVDRIEKNVAFNMAAQNFKRLPGNNWKVSLRNNEKIVIKIEPNSQLFVQYPDLINREYSWKKREFDAFVTAENAPEELKKICEISKSQSAVFSANKGVNN